jgi:hypothetical protein
LDSQSTLSHVPETYGSTLLSSIQCFLFLICFLFTICPRDI